MARKPAHTGASSAAAAAATATASDAKSKSKSKFAEDAGLSHLVSLSQSIAEAKSQHDAQRIESSKHKLHAIQQKKTLAQAARNHKKSELKQSGKVATPKSKAEIKAQLKKGLREKVKKRKDARKSSRKQAEQHGQEAKIDGVAAIADEQDDERQSTPPSKTTSNLKKSPANSNKRPRKSVSFALA